MRVGTAGSVSVAKRPLYDVFNRTNPKILEKHKRELAKLATVDPSLTASRFVRNSVFIDPKSLHLLLDSNTLSQHKVFAVYKPPFCPLRRSEAVENFHKVSVESYVEAALKSIEIAGEVRQLASAENLQIRVLYELSHYQSGPMVVALAKQFDPREYLLRSVQIFDTMVFGHLKVMDTDVEAPAPELFAASPKSSGSLGKCCFKVERNGWYVHYPVSLVRYTIRGSAVALAPRLTEFTSKFLGTFIVGDPAALKKENAATLATAIHRGQSGKLTLHEDRGDFDFSRVFEHLTTVVTSQPNETKEEFITFSCPNCIDSYVWPSKVMRTQTLGSNDGLWHPRFIVRPPCPHTSS